MANSSTYAKKKPRTLTNMKHILLFSLQRYCYCQTKHQETKEEVLATHHILTALNFCIYIITIVFKQETDKNIRPYYHIFHRGYSNCNWMVIFQNLLQTSPLELILHSYTFLRWPHNTSSKDQRSPVDDTYCFILFK